MVVTRSSSDRAGKCVCVRRYDLRLLPCQPLHEFVEQKEASGSLIDMLWMWDRGPPDKSFLPKSPRVKEPYLMQQYPMLPVHDSMIRLWFV